MVTLKNLSQKTLITKKAKVASSFFDRLFGLLNPHNPRFLIFFTHFGIHTFFMGEAIDVILLDRNNTVVKIKENLSPNRLFLYSPRYSTLIEMPQDTIKKFHISINDKISIA